MLRQVVVHAAASRLLAPAQLSAELPPPGRRAVSLLTVRLDGRPAALAALQRHRWGEGGFNETREGLSEEQEGFYQTVTPICLF